MRDRDRDRTEMERQEGEREIGFPSKKKITICKVLPQTLKFD